MGQTVQTSSERMVSSLTGGDRPRWSSKSCPYYKCDDDADYMTMYGHEQLLSLFCRAARINQSLGRAGAPIGDA
jgi:hypothetical protein